MSFSGVGITPKDITADDLRELENKLGARLLQDVADIVDILKIKNNSWDTIINADAIPSADLKALEREHLIKDAPNVQQRAMAEELTGNEEIQLRVTPQLVSLLFTAHKNATAKGSDGRGI